MKKKKLLNTCQDYQRRSETIRGIMGSSNAIVVKVKDAIKIMNSYIEMERGRYDSELIIEFDVDKYLLKKNPLVPSMILYPHLENAIMHGFTSDMVENRIEIILSEENNLMKCIIRDNGIGREASSKRQNKNKHLKMASKNTKERIQILESLGFEGSDIQINDLYDDNGIPIGTEVVLYLPIVTPDGIFA